MTGAGATLGSPSESLRRLAVVYADPLRMKIVSELYTREMSPTRFYEEFGGGSVSRVDRHFKRLAEHSWLTYMRSESGGSRRGGVEHFYSATELVVFDDDLWAELPASIRASFSLVTLEQLAERAGAALIAGTFDARADRRLSWASMLLDERGWKRAIALVNAAFAALLEEQERARLRLLRSGETPLLATVALAAFESPPRGRPRRRPPNRAGTGLQGIGSARTAGESMHLFPAHFAKLLADPIDLRIVTETNRREVSPTLFHSEFGGTSVSALGRRFQRLSSAGWLGLRRTETGGQRRGGVEHFYRAAAPVVLDNAAWTERPESLDDDLEWRRFARFREGAIAAVEAGTFDARTDRHLTWSALRLDRPGWRRAIAGLDRLREELRAEGDAAKRRIERSGERPIPATVAMTAFESPGHVSRAP